MWYVRMLYVSAVWCVGVHVCVITLLSLPPLQVRHIYTGPLDEEDEMAESMLTCDPEVHTHTHTQRERERIERRAAPVQHWSCLTRTQGWDGWLLLALPSGSVYPPQFLPHPFPSPAPSPPSFLPPRVLSHSTSPNCIPHKTPPSSTPLAES